MRHRWRAPRSVFAVVAASLAAACGASPSAPTKTTPAPTVTAVGISGASKLVVGTPVQLTATVHFSEGGDKDCPSAVWASSDSSVATVSSSGLAQALKGGQATISANCGGQSGTLAITAFGVTTLQGTLHESAPTVSVAIAGADVALTDVAGQRFDLTSDAAGQFSAAVAAGPVAVVATRDGYQSASRNVDASATSTVDLGLSPVNVLVTVSGTSTICSFLPISAKFCSVPNAPPQVVHYLLGVHNDGQLTVDLGWDYDIEDNILLDLSCNGTVIYSSYEHGAGPLRSVAVPIRGGCRYDVALRFDSRRSSLTYTYTIRRPS